MRFSLAKTHLEILDWVGIKSAVGIMELRIVYGEVFKKHRTPDGSYHPENPARLDIAVASVRNRFGHELRFEEPPRGRLEDVLRVHEESYVRLVERVCRRGGGWLDSDTYVCSESWDVALTAVSSCVDAVEKSVSSGAAYLVLARPPGHHAGRAGRALGAITQGFCVFNNVACAAAKALELGLSPVLVVDFDLHHGNGTQEIFWEDPRVIHFDAHLRGIYPGTGWVTDVGGGEGEGTKINFAADYGFGDDEYIYAFQTLLPPLVDHFKPRAILVSAGFDGYAEDYLEGLELTEKFFRFVGALLASMARSRSVPLVATLEGGYTKGLSHGLAAFIEGLLSEETEVGIVNPSARARELVNELRIVLRKYVPI